MVGFYVNIFHMVAFQILLWLTPFISGSHSIFQAKCDKFIKIRFSAIPRVTSQEES